jgi:N-acetylglucosamine kinase-like BadF-type ATPase
MKLFLGIDGGQSGTTALIGDETGRIIGSGEAGPCNHAAATEGRLRLERAITGSLAAACQQGGLDPSEVRFEAACLGMSGGPEDKQEIAARLIRTQKLLVTTDAAIALAGATPGGDGIITIGGTGSIAYGRNSAGRTARAGGWGYIFGDEGGAFDIVRQATRAALRAQEGWGPPTRLQGLLLEATASSDPNQMLHRFYTPDWPRSRVAALAHFVDRAAEESDSVALEILDRAARDLARLALAIRSQLWAAGEPVYVAYIGGVFQSRRVLEGFRQFVEAETGVTCGPPQRGPAEGALAEAYRLAGR